MGEPTTAHMTSDSAQSRAEALYTIIVFAPQLSRQDAIEKLAAAFREAEARVWERIQDILEGDMYCNVGPDDGGKFVHNQDIAYLLTLVKQAREGRG